MRDQDGTGRGGVAAAPVWLPEAAVATAPEIPTQRLPHEGVFVDDSVAVPVASPWQAPATAALRTSAHGSTFAAPPVPGVPVAAPVPGVTDPLGRGSSGPAVAVAAFVLAVLVWPVGLFTGLVGLARTRNGRPGRGLAVAAVVVGLVLGMASGWAATRVVPSLDAQRRAWSQARTTQSLASVATWMVDQRTATGGYPAALDSSAPATATAVSVLLAGAPGTAPCLQAGSDADTQHAAGAEGFVIRPGACG